MKDNLIKVFLLLLVLQNLCAFTYAQDKKALPVYNEYSILWFPAGWMPDTVAISFQDDFDENCHSGKTCIKIGYNCRKRSWAGIYWLANGSWFGRGINLYRYLEVNKETPIMLTFWARGEHGEENVQFKVGGVKDGKDSIKRAIETDWIKLTKTWRQYRIDLTGEDLSNLVGGFCWVTNRAQNLGREEVWLYLDDIRFETD